MTDRTADIVYKTKPRDGRDAFPIADGVAIGLGALVQLESGYLNHWDEAGEFRGIMINGDARANDGVFTGETSDTPLPHGFVDESGVTVMHIAVAGTATQAKVGDLIYCADSDLANATLTRAGTESPIGILTKFRSVTDCDVTLFTPTEWHAGVATATWTT